MGEETSEMSRVSSPSFFISKQAELGGRGSRDPSDQPELYIKGVERGLAVVGAVFVYITNNL
ncbi:hypothetical protein OROMI_007359 [Orobanche minor]